MGGCPGAPGLSSAGPFLTCFLRLSPGGGPPRPVVLAPQGDGWGERASGLSARSTHALFPAVFPARTISACPSTSRPASYSVGGAPPLNYLSRGDLAPLPSVSNSGSADHSLCSVLPSVAGPASVKGAGRNHA